MTVCDAIRKAVEDYHKKYFDSPNVCYMSMLTLDMINDEIAKYLNAVVFAGKNNIYGMRIDVKNYLPTGVVVVGGVLWNVFDGKEEE